MGTFSHDALIIEGGEKERDEVLRICADIDGDFARLVTPVVSALVNSGEWFVMLPDGSKEWWDRSDRGDEIRKRVIEAMGVLGALTVAVRWGELGQGVRVFFRGEEI